MLWTQICTQATSLAERNPRLNGYLSSIILDFDDLTTAISYHLHRALSGHAHGGIVRLPFIGGLLDVHRRLGAEYEKGVYEENNTVMIVSRGLGNSIVVPRFLNRPELVCVTLSIDSKTSD